MTTMLMRFHYAPEHYLGPAVIDTAAAHALVDVAPTKESARRIADALNEAVDESPAYALPKWDALEGHEPQRVHRYLMRLVQSRETP